MENKKLLWIIFSAVLFVAVVVSVGLLLFWPSAGGAASVERRTAEEDEFDPIEWVRGDEEYPGIEKDRDGEEDDEFVIVYGESGEEQPEEGEDAEPAPAGEETAEDAEEQVTETDPVSGKDGPSSEGTGAAAREERAAERP
ncbi:MAG: hypothetical protein ACOCX6_02125, partial [bacterium]